MKSINRKFAMKTGNTKHLPQALAVTLLIGLCTLILSACELESVPLEGLGDIEGGANTWIEYPPEGEVFTMGAIPITVYAAGQGGVGSISVNVGGQAVAVTELTPLINDSSLVRADLLWQPPGEGEYLILASAGGAPASLRFCVVTCETSEPEPDEPTGPTDTPTATLPVITLAPDEPTWTPTPTPAASDTPTATPANTETPTPTAYVSPTPTPTQYSSPTPTPYTESSAEFWAAPPYINSGECTTLNWNVYGDFQTVYFEGSPVNASGSDSECPAESYTFHLQVLEMDGSTTDYWTSVDVSEPPPADTSGPSINWTNLVVEGCQFFGQAGIYDESGVGWAQFYFNKDGEGWASVWMQEISTETWESEVGITLSSDSGSIDYYIIASDNLGNESESGSSTYYYDTGCGGF
jgi:hypothetical protein